MTHNHDDTPYSVFNTFSGTCWRVSEFIDFDLKNRNSDLSACFSALICDFSQFIKIPISKTMNTGFLRICENLLFMYSWKWSELYKFIRLEIVFLLTYHSPAKDIAVLKSGTRNDFRNSLSIWHTEQIVTITHFFEHG